MNTNENTFTHDLAESVSVAVEAIVIMDRADSALAKMAAILTNAGADQMSSEFYWKEFRPAYIAEAVKDRSITAKSAETRLLRAQARIHVLAEEGKSCRFVIPPRVKVQTPAAQKMRERRANVSPEVAKAKALLDAAKAAQKDANKAVNNALREARADISAACRCITDIKDLRAILTYATKRQPGDTVKGRRA